MYHIYKLLAISRVKIRMKLYLVENCLFFVLFVFRLLYVLVI